MKKSLYIALSAVLLVMASCQKPQYVLPTVERQGITSLTAYFTTGKYVDQQIAKLEVSDETTDYYVIEIPWYYPEETTDGTAIYMSSLRVRAELAPDCKIDPPLTILDLNLENHFTFTNNKGESRPIVITGKRTKFRRTEVMSFSLVEPYPVDGFVDAEAGKIYLFTTDDLDGFTAEGLACTHATIMDDFSAPRNYNEPQTLTVMAHDEVTTQTYIIEKRTPEKIPYGFNDGSARQLFNFDPVTRLGMPPYTTETYLSMGVVGSKLVISTGDGSAPVYLNGMTGVKEGTIVLGSASADGITSDEAGNLILAGNAEAGETMDIYVTKSVSEAPHLFYTYENKTDLPAGRHIKVAGDVEGDAVIILTHEGVTGVTTSGKYTQLVVRGGAVAEVNEFDLSSSGFLWGAAPVNAAKVVPATADPANGVLFSYYEEPYCLTNVNANGNISQKDIAEDNSWGINYNKMDGKTYNGAFYLAHFYSSHFPNWGLGPRLYVYDLSTPSLVKNAEPVFADEYVEWYQQAGYEGGTASGDVILAPSADGFRLFAYYYDHMSQVVGGYTFDCIKK